MSTPTEPTDAVVNYATVPSKFELDIKMFNEMYKLAGFKNPRELHARLIVFKDMLAEELDEIDAIIADLEEPEGVDKLATMTNLADLFGDLQVYCASEMVRHNIPVQATLDIIMASNFSKLGADGLPIYRDDGKVMKGPDYWKPEPQIANMLLNHWTSK